MMAERLKAGVSPAHTILPKPVFRLLSKVPVKTSPFKYLPTLGRCEMHRQPHIHGARVHTLALSHTILKHALVDVAICIVCSCFAFSSNQYDYDGLM